MKMKALDSNTKKPLANMKIQLQIKGKDSGFLSLTTDQNGEFKLDEKYKGQQLTGSINGIQSQWLTVNDGATLQIDTKQRATTGSSSKEKNKETWK